MQENGPITACDTVIAAGRDGIGRFGTIAGVNPYEPGSSPANWQSQTASADACRFDFRPPEEHARMIVRRRSYRLRMGAPVFLIIALALFASPGTLPAQVLSNAPIPAADAPR